MKYEMLNTKYLNVLCRALFDRRICFNREHIVLKVEISGQCIFQTRKYKLFPSQLFVPATCLFIHQKERFEVLNTRLAKVSFYILFINDKR